MALGILTIIGK